MGQENDPPKDSCKQDGKKGLLKAGEQKSEKKKEPKAPLIERLINLEMSLRDDGLVYLWGVMFFFFTVLVGIFGVYHVLWKLEELLSTDTVLKVWLGVGRFGGRIVTVNAGLLLLSGCLRSAALMRESGWMSALFPFDSLMPHFHMYLAGTTFVAGVVHTVALSVVYETKLKEWTYDVWSMSGEGARTVQSLITGVILLAAFGTMLVIPFQRRKYFRIFWAHHLVMIIVIYTCLVIHGCFFGKPYSYQYLVFPIGLWLCDKIWRVVSASKAFTEPKAGTATDVGGGVIEVRLPKPFDYRPGMYARICIPEVAKYEFHAFTIASSPLEAEMKFYIKAVGHWTKALQAVASKEGVAVTVHVTGPLGAPAEHFSQFEEVVLVAGGIGATPMHSIVTDIVLRRKMQEADNALLVKPGNPAFDNKVSPDIANSLLHAGADIVKPMNHFRAAEASLITVMNHRNLGPLSRAYYQAQLAWSSMTHVLISLLFSGVVSIALYTFVVFGDLYDYNYEAYETFGYCLAGVGLLWAVCNVISHTAQNLEMMAVLKTSFFKRQHGGRIRTILWGLAILQLVATASLLTIESETEGALASPMHRGSRHCGAQGSKNYNDNCIITSQDEIDLVLYDQRSRNGNGNGNDDDDDNNNSNNNNDDDDDNNNNNGDRRGKNRFHRHLLQTDLNETECEETGGKKKSCNDKEKEDLQVDNYCDFGEADDSYDTSGTNHNFYALILPFIVIELLSMGVRFYAVLSTAETQPFKGSLSQVRTRHITVIWVGQNPDGFAWFKASLDKICEMCKKDPKMASYVDASMYLTRLKKEDAEAAGIQLGGNPNSVQVHLGRPNWDQILKKEVQRVAGKDEEGGDNFVVEGDDTQVSLKDVLESNAVAKYSNTIGVFFCGPHVIATQIGASVIKCMHSQFTSKTAGGERTFDHFIRMLFRKENF